MMTKPNWTELLVLVLATTAMSAGCHREPDAPAATAPPASASTTPSTDATGAGTVASDTRTTADAPAATPTAVTPGAALALVASIDEHEIAAAEQARRKNLQGPVLEFANLLHREHSANLKAGQALSSGAGAIQPERTADVEAMRTKGASELAALDQKSGKEYEAAYVDAMVKGHTEALALLDERLIPAAQDERLRNFLTNTRDHVAMHLQRGKDLQAAPR